MENLQMYIVWRESLNQIKCISIILKTFYGSVILKESCIGL